MRINASFVNETFEDLRRNKRVELKIDSCESKNTRTGCMASRGVLTKHRSLINALVSKTDQTIPIFVKLSTCSWNNDDDGSTVHAMNYIGAHESPSSVEVRFFELTNRLQERGICDTFVRSYNHFLKRHIVKHPETVEKDYYLDDDGVAVWDSTYPHDRSEFHPYLTMLLTDDISSYSTLESTLRGRLTDNEHACILFQLFYAIQCLAQINMAHMDLHDGNIYVKKLRGIQHRKYTYLSHDNTFKTVIIPITHDVKIIDLDGSYKFEAGKNVKAEFRSAIRNRHMTTGDPLEKGNPRYNAIKIAHTYKARFPDFLYKRLFGSYFKSSNGKVPHVNFTLKEYLSSKGKKYDAYYLKYGIFRNGRTKKGIDINDKLIMHPGYILNEIASKAKVGFVPEQLISSSYSMEKIFEKPEALTPKKKSPVTPKQKTPVTPKKKTPVTPKQKSPVTPKKKTPVTPKKKTPVRPVPSFGITRKIIAALEEEVKAKCGKPKAGRPNKVCSEALNRARTICKLNNGVFEKRICRPRKKPVRKR